MTSRVEDIITDAILMLNTELEKAKKDKDDCRSDEEFNYLFLVERDCITALRTLCELIISYSQPIVIPTKKGANNDQQQTPPMAIS